jgi:hypothetical protein
VHSPLLPTVATGRWYNGTLHETDWVATLLGLVNRTLGLGLATTGGSGSAGLNYSWDGMDAWPALIAPAAPVQVRTEVLLAHNILRRGQYKLIAGSGTDNQTWQQGMLRDCMLGTGGGWDVPPVLSTNGTVGLCPTSVYKVDEEEFHPWGGEENDQSQISCDNVDAWGEDVDRWLCSEPCTRASPCLYDLESDPGERLNVAEKHPTLVATMLTRLKELRKTFFYPGAPIEGDYCGTVRRNGYWVGPWV